MLWLRCLNSPLNDHLPSVRTLSVVALMEALLAGAPMYATKMQYVYCRDVFAGNFSDRLYVQRC